MNLINIPKQIRKRDKLYVGLITFFVLIVYVSSAWWSWYYGGSYGQRVVVDFLCVFAIFQAYVLNQLEYKRKLKRDKGIKCCLTEIVVYMYCCICIVWNCICMLAYWYRMIPSDGANWQNLQAVIQWL